VDQSIPIFGEQIKGRNYRPRPSAYGIIFDEQKRVSVVLTPRGYFLPGGGIEPGESPQEALAREIREESGRQIEIGDLFAQATQFVFAPGEGYFAKHCAFFTAIFRDVIATPAEPDHQLVWLAPHEAARKLNHASQAWALARALGLQHAACAILIQEGKILLGKRAPFERVCPDRWDIFGGHLEPGEGPADALVREIREELGVTASKFVECTTLIEYESRLGGPAAFHLYVVRRWDGRISMLGDEHTELGWFTIPQACVLPDLAHPEYPGIFRTIST
jgi:8-oxo-dGTP diphosphatase